jgi:Lar family restriction alleviation protein
MLRPCPYCGDAKAAVDTLNYTSGKPGRFRVQCGGCGAASGWRDTAVKAEEAWNSRTTQTTRPALGAVFTGRDAFFFRGVLYMRDRTTKYCYAGSDKKSFKRIRKADYQRAYDECEKEAVKGT